LWRGLFHGMAMNRNNAKNSSRRAAYYGVLMAVIVFGGMLYYLIDTRPRSYRAEGGDLWVFEHFQTSQKQQLIDKLSLQAKDFDAAGFWGLEILSSDGPDVTLLTRWQNQKAYQSFLQSQSAHIFDQDPATLLKEPTIEQQEVKARR
jgi:hypothetical protein